MYLRLSLCCNQTHFLFVTLCCYRVRYAATIEKIDYDTEQVLIHYRQWSRRHDEWFQWSSPYLRPLERVSLRRQGLNPPCSQPVRHADWVCAGERASFNPDNWKVFIDTEYKNSVFVWACCSVSLCSSSFIFVSVSDVCFGYEGSGLLDRLSFLPGQNPPGQQGRWGSVSPLTPDVMLLYGRAEMMKPTEN